MSEIDQSPLPEGRPSTNNKHDPSISRNACVRCQSRKVRCDKLLPQCSKCLKGHSECQYRDPAPPRRGKRKLEESDLQARVRHMESFMRKNGLEVPPAPGMLSNPYGSPNSSSSNNVYAASTRASYSDYLSPNNAIHANSVSKRSAESKYTGQSRNPLWQDLEELRATGRGQASSDDDEYDQKHLTQPGHSIPTPFPNDSEDLFLGVPTACTDQSLILPTPESCSRLWQVYQENFNPLSHVIHIPTTDPLIVEAMSINQRFTPSERALVFAILAASVSTLRDEECQQFFSQSKDAMQSRFRLATKQALIKARLLSTSNILVLQAFVIYLISCHQSHSAEAAWTLSGVAMRLGMRLGIKKRDLVDLDPFEAQMRTRLWWQICVYDTQLSEVAGQRALQVDLLGDMDIPLNVNDADLYPGMKSLPLEHEGATEMMFIRIRYEFGTFLRKGGLEKLFPENTIDTGDMREAMAEKDKIIDGLEKIFEDRYLRYCDPLVPLQFLSTILARCIIARLRLMAHHPRQYADKGASLPTSEKDMLFALSLKALEYDTIVESSPTIRGFRWHTQNQIQWLALVHVLSDLRKRTAGLESDKAWRQVESIYRNHSQMKEIRQRPIFKALASLVNSAWKNREDEHLRRYGTPLSPLPFVAELRERIKVGRGAVEKRESVAIDSAYGSHAVQPTLVAQDVIGDLTMVESMLTDFDDLSPVNWAEWDDLVRDFEIHEQPGLFE